MNKPVILQLSAILIPAIRERLAERFEVHRYFEIEDQAAFLASHGARIRGVVTGGHTGIARTLLEQLPAVEVIAVNGVGTDAIDLAYCRDRGIKVAATLGALTEDVADLAVGLLIGACRGLMEGDGVVRAGHWATRPAPLAPLPLARRISGLRAGLVGRRRVGRAVATRVAAFGCPVAYTDLRPMADVEHTFIGDLVELARQSDALVVAAAADQASGIINAQVLEALGPDGFLVNIARGKLVDEAALIAALRKGQIAGAGLDVFVDEPRVPAALREDWRVVLQPHRASATVETRTRMGEMVIEALETGLAGGEPAGRVA